MNRRMVAIGCGITADECARWRKAIAMFAIALSDVETEYLSYLRFTRLTPER